MLNTIKLSEFLEILEFVVQNNMKLEEKGMRPKAINIEGPAGIGKTESILSFCKERGMTVSQINLAEMEDVGDMNGFPVKEVEVELHDKNDMSKILGRKWILESQMNLVTPYIKFTGNRRTSYAPPAWVPSQYNEKGTILFLDDYTRATPQFMQATMELINKGEYMAWKLPERTTIVLSTNPAGGEYSVTSLDIAQLSRFLSYKVEFEVKEWAKWAEGKLDSRIINFAVLMEKELFHVTKEQEEKGIVPPANARNFTTFGQLLDGLDKKIPWTESSMQAKIIRLSKGCFLYDDNNIIGRLFLSFLENKWDKLPSPEELIDDSWDELRPKMEDCIRENNVLRPDMASLLTMRLCNHILYLFGKKGGVKEEKVLNRILDIVTNREKLFTDDLVFHLCKTLISKYPGRTNTLKSNSIIRQRLML